MPYATCTVDFSKSPPASSPDPVPVTRGTQGGVEWTANQTGYTFTGVKINDVAAPTGDFGTPVISTNAAGKSVMTVPDTVADLGDYSYTLEYTGPSGAGSFDPTIRNRQ